MKNEITRWEILTVPYVFRRISVLIPVQTDFEKHENKIPFIGFPFKEPFSIQKTGGKKLFQNWQSISRGRDDQSTYFQNLDRRELILVHGKQDRTGRCLFLLSIDIFLQTESMYRSGLTETNTEDSSRLSFVVIHRGCCEIIISNTSTNISRNNQISSNGGENSKNCTKYRLCILLKVIISNRVYSNVCRAKLWNNG